MALLWAYRKKDDSADVLFRYDYLQGILYTETTCELGWREVKTFRYAVCFEWVRLIGHLSLNVTVIDWLNSWYSNKN